MNTAAPPVRERSGAGLHGRRTGWGIPGINWCRNDAEKLQFHPIAPMMLDDVTRIPSQCLIAAVRRTREAVDDGNSCIPIPLAESARGGLRLRVAVAQFSKLSLHTGV